MAILTKGACKINTVRIEYKQKTLSPHVGVIPYGQEVEVDI